MSENSANQSDNMPHVVPPKKNRDGRGIKWYDRRLLFPSLIVFVLLSALFYGLAMRHKPPEGYVFPREPVIRGIYRCCEAGGRYSASWVGAKQVRCSPFSYYVFLGRNLDDCGLREKLNEQLVEVTEVVLPSVGAKNSVVVQIRSYGQLYYDVSDQKIRELWVFASTTAAPSLAMTIATIFHFMLFVYLNYFNRPVRRGEQ